MLKCFGKNKKSVLFLAFFLFLFSINDSKASNFLPNDPYFKDQWYLNRIGFTQIWGQNFKGREVVVAVIDSGVNIDNPDLVDKIWVNKFEKYNSGIDDDHNGFIDDLHGWDFILNIPDPRPKLTKNSDDAGLNHGTMIAGIIGASTNNGLGISGIAKNVKIMPLRALDDRGEGKISDVIRAIDYAVNNGADIINLSFSGLAYNKGFNEAVERAYKSGVIVVAAAGNNSNNLDNEMMYPACFKGSKNENIIITVGSTDTLDQKANFSSYGSKCVDISAPGISFFSTYFYDNTETKEKYYNGYWSGTSMSAALVSGSLALIKEANPKLNSKELVDILLKSADDINKLNLLYENKLGSGRVNLSSSINWALEKWSNLDSRFLIFPQSDIRNFKSSSGNENFNTVKILKNKGVEEFSFFAYDKDFNGSINMISADVDGDGVKELITGAGEGGGPHVKIFDIAGNLKGQFFAYEQKFRGGVNVAIGDVDGDGLVEIITGAGVGGGPHVRIFDTSGNLKGQFFAYDQNFKGGVNVAVGDINGNGKSEIITGAGPGGGPHVRVFSGSGELLGQFFAYEDNFFGGIKIRLANIYGKDSKDRKEIVVVPGPGRVSEIKIFSSSGQELKKIIAYSNNFKNGINLSVGDLDKDGLDEVITGAGPGGTPHIRAFNGRGELLASFYGLESEYSGGIVVEFMEIYN